MNNRFIIIVPFFNVEKTIQKTLSSVLKQTYSNYACILIDDMSTDDSYKKCEDIIRDNDSFYLIKNKKKKNSTRNIYEAIYKYTEENDIVVILDGDDFLFGKDVLSYLNNFYNKSNCWLTYGSYLELSNGLRGKFAKQIPEYVIKNNSYREHEWITSHLRSFRSFLYKKIKKEDFLNNENKKFFTRAGDLVIMFPMLEMAGEKACYIEKILYVWNNLSNLNEHKVDHTQQLANEKQIRSRKKYEKII
tara:strand:+ start:1345 stop:2085 length:741 start_codon:yes stop_codon:yes gene_type:complete